MWTQIRGGLMFGVACVTSPCCTPLIVPLGLVLLAGTPAAVWLSAYIGWVYGALTLISLVSFVLAFRWLMQKNEAKRSTEIVSKSVSQPIPEIKSS